MTDLLANERINRLEAKVDALSASIRGIVTVMLDGYTKATQGTGSPQGVISGYKFYYDTVNEQMYVNTSLTQAADGWKLLA